MKTILSLLAVAVIFSACSKSNSSGSVSADVYLNTNAGSSWSFTQTDETGTNPPANYTVTSTSKDTTVGSQKYHVFTYSYGGSEYLGVDGNNYYQYDSIPVSGGINIDRLYLKSNASAGDTWNQDFSLDIPGSPIPVPLTVTNKIAEKGISRTVNGTQYSNVIHVTTTLSSALIPASSFTSSIDSYYAPNYGLIENTSVIQLNYQGLDENINVKTVLTGATLK
ncbi:MAG: hypothetical protein ACTHK8_07545 [Ginsengibacter sp.]